MRMSSMLSAEEPPMTSTLLPFISPWDSRRMTACTVSSRSAIFAFLPSIRGPTNPTPALFSLSIASATMGLLNMAPCIAGAITIGTPEPRATEAIVVTGVSSMPQAILQMVLAVAGAMSSRSALP